MTGTAYEVLESRKTTVERLGIERKTETDWHLFEHESETDDESQARVTIRIAPSIEELSILDLVERLTHCEEQLGKSSVELLADYLSEDVAHTDDLERWFDYFFLYLGTEKVKRLVCT